MAAGDNILRKMDSVQIKPSDIRIVYIRSLTMGGLLGARGWRQIAGLGPAEPRNGATSRAPTSTDTLACEADRYGLFAVLWRCSSPAALTTRLPGPAARPDPLLSFRQPRTCPNPAARRGSVLNA